MLWLCYMHTQRYQNMCLFKTCVILCKMQYYISSYKVITQKNKLYFLMQDNKS